MSPSSGETWALQLHRCREWEGGTSRSPFHVCCGCGRGWWGSAGAATTPARSSSSSDAPRDSDPSVLSTDIHKKSNQIFRISFRAETNTKCINRVIERNGYKVKCWYWFCVYFIMTSKLELHFQEYFTISVISSNQHGTGFLKSLSMLFFSGTGCR